MRKLCFMIVTGNIENDHPVAASFCAWTINNSRSNGLGAIYVCSGADATSEEVLQETLDTLNKYVRHEEFLIVYAGATNTNLIPTGVPCKTFDGLELYKKICDIVGDHDKNHRMIRTMFEGAIEKLLEKGY